MKNVNIKIIVPLLLIIAGGAYKFVLAKPAAPGPKPKVDGEVYVMPREFLVNLRDGKFAKIAVALVFDHGYSALPVAAVGPQDEPDAVPAVLVAAGGPAAAGAETWSDIPRSAQDGSATADGGADYRFTGAAPPPAKPPEGYGTLSQEPIVRAIITDELTKMTSDRLMSIKGRERLKKRLLKRFKKETDVKVHEVLFTDIAVQ